MSAPHDGVTAVIPVKRFATAKMRLGAALSASARVALARNMFVRTLTLIQSAPGIASVTVVTADGQAQALAHAAGARVAAEPEGAGLNEALAYAVASAGVAPDGLAAIVPTDLPLLSAGEVAAFLALGGKGRMAIAPDRRRSGTNGLIIEAALTGALQFGPDSYAKHVRLAQTAGLELMPFTAPGFACDLDEAEDLAELRRTGALDAFFQ